MCLRSLGDAGGVFAHADVAPVVGAVLDGVPVSAHGLEQSGFVVDIRVGAADVEGILLLFFIDAPAAQVVAFAPDGDELSASAQPGFFGGDGFALDAPARQPPVLFDPAAVMSAGKKTPGAV